MQVFFKAILIHFVTNLTLSSARSLITLLKDSSALSQKERVAVLQFSSFNTEMKGPFPYKKVASSQLDHNPHVGVLSLVKLIAWVGTFVF